MENVDNSLQPTQPVVVVLVHDHDVAARISHVVRIHGGEPILVETPKAFVDAIDHFIPALAFVDLSAPGDLMGAVQRVKLRPHSRHLPIHAFGSPEEADLLNAVRLAGADHVWSRGQLMTELPGMVATSILPATIRPAGWDSPLSDLARRGIELLNQGEFFEQHELLEHAWLEETRPIREMYQGILQVGVAFLQIERNNWPGAVKMFRRGLPRLRHLPEVCQGIRIGDFCRAAELIHDEITRLGPDHMAAFDRSRFPAIAFDSEP
jgi:hypothetical protein